MYTKKTLIALATALALVAGAPLALASDRDDSTDAHQSQLDAQFARAHAGVPGVSAAGKAGDAYGYVPPAHQPAKTNKR
jgi:hypothetical protein